MDFVGIGFIAVILGLCLVVAFVVLTATGRFQKYALAICLIALGLTALGWLNAQDSIVRTGASMIGSGFAKTDICEGVSRNDRYCYETIHTRGFPLQSIETSTNANGTLHIGLYGDSGAKYRYVWPTIFNYFVAFAATLFVFFVIDVARSKQGN